MSFWRFFRRARWDDERARELESYLAIETDENIARGMPAGAARAAARRKLGNTTHIREEIYDVNTLPILETARLDLRDALRQLRRRPLVTVLALLLLTIGIGASAAAFGVAYGVLVRPLPYPDAERLAVVWEQTRGRHGQVSYLDFQDVRRAVPFETTALLGSGRATITAGGDTDRVNIVGAEPALLPLLGGRPLLGRLIQAGDAGRARTVVSHRLWQSVFHGDPDVVGKPIVVGGTQYVVVGVAAAGLDFELPIGAAEFGSGFTIKDVDLWMAFDPREALAQSRAVSTYEAIVKLAPGQTINAAQSAVDVVAANLQREYPETNRNRGFRVLPLHESIVGAKSPAVVMALAGALLILAIAFANLASLFLGELPERRRDFALREALGAGRGRLVRQLALEGAVVSTVGGAIGVMLARGIVESFKRAADLPRPEAIRFDLPVTVAIAAAALTVGVLSRLLPLVRLPRAIDDLRSSVSAYASSAPLARRALVVVQLALAVVLSGAAILLAASLRRIVTVDPGFAASHAVSARVSAYASRHPSREQTTRFVNELVARTAALPGVQAAAASSAVPLAGSTVGTSVGLEGQLLPMAERPSAGWQTVTPGYFASLGIQVLSGRDFEPADLAHAGHVTIVNQSLARRLFGDTNPIGRRLAIGAGDPVSDWHEIVGVVSDARHSSLAVAPAPRLYDLIGQHGNRTVYLIARGPADPYSLVPAIRGVVNGLDSEAPVFEVQSLEDIVDGTVAPRRLATGFAIGIAGASLLLAAIGLYGLLASVVAARTKELGIRRALGSTTAGIVRLVSGEAVVLAAAGITIGVAIALPAARAIQSQLFGIQATDARVIAAVAVVLVAVGSAAAYLPVRRAARVDPAVALRHE